MRFVSPGSPPGNLFLSQFNETCASEIKFSSFYSVFQGFSKAKSANGGSILSSSQFLLLPQLPKKMELALKVVKVDSKIIVSITEI